MGNPGLTDEQMVEAVKAAAAFPTQQAAADSLGLHRATFRNRLKQAAKQGLTGRYPPAPDGFEVKEISERVDKSGQVTGQSIKYVEASGPKFELPEGQKLKAQSVLTDGEGNQKLVWHKAVEADRDPAEIAATIEKALSGFKPFAPAIMRLKDHDQDRLTVYVMSDWHVGMFAWGKETDGYDWDLSIARDVLTRSFSELVELAPPSENALILGLGDLMHADSHKNQTPTSGNLMDVDTRYAKVLPATCEILVNCCEMVRAKHRSVEVEIKAGNHDIASTVGMREAIRMYYRNDKRVAVGSSPSPFVWKRFGVNLICGTHGDGVRAKDLPLTMANLRAEDWAEAKSKHAHTGHLHNEFTFEQGGVKVHQHRAPIPADAWHHANGYRAGRSMRAFHYHRDYGARGSSEVEIL